MYAPHIFRVAVATMIALFSMQALADNAEQETRRSAQAAVGEIEREISAAIDKAGQSVVRVGWGKDERLSGCSGVIVDAEGHVVTSGRERLIAGSPVVCYLADGRRATGKLLGASWELGLGVLLLDGQGPWPHARLGKSKDSPLGSLCLALGYPLLDGGRSPYDGRPLPRLGQVAVAAAVPNWLLTSCRLNGSDRGGGLFNLDGELIGIHIKDWAIGGHGGEPGYGVHAGVEKLLENWEALLAGTAPGSHFEAPSESSPDPAATAELTGDEKTRIAPAIDKARGASVGLQWGPDPRDGCSGTIISADGYIATCEHHERPCGEALTVHLSDGRSVAGKVLCSDPVLDIGLMKITEAGTWPFVERAKSVETKLGDFCIGLGYPVRRPDGRGPRWREPLVRLGRILNTSIAPGCFAASGQVYGGDSGGGLFDAQGRLIGIHIGGIGLHARDLTWRAGCELFETHWRFLARDEPFEALPPIGLGHTTELLERATGDLPAITVEVLAGKRRCCLGTIVGANGWVLAKASELGETVTCRLADGSQLSAEVRGIDLASDLALLKVDGQSLPTIELGDDEPPTAASLVAVSRFNSRPLIAMVSQTVHAAPREGGWLFIGRVRGGKDGVEVVDDSDAVKNGEAIR